MPVGPPVCVATNAPPSSHSDLPESCDGVHEGGDVMSSKYSLTVTRKEACASTWLCQGWCSQGPQTGWLKIDIYVSTVLELDTPNLDGSRTCSPQCVLTRACSFQRLRAEAVCVRYSVGLCRHLWACGPTSPCGLLPSLFLIRTHAFAFRANQLEDDLIWKS